MPILTTGQYGFTTTPPDWQIDKSVRLGVYRIKSQVDGRYFVVFDPGSAANLRFAGELIGRQIHEQSNVFYPRTFDSFERAALNIQVNLTESRLPQLLADHQTLVGREHRLRSWKVLTETEKAAMAADDSIQAKRFSRTRRNRRREVARRLGMQPAFLDSYDPPRQNPLMKRVQLLKCVLLAWDEIPPELNSVNASGKRQLFALEMGQQVASEVQTVLRLVEGKGDLDRAKLDLALDRLVIKPFYFAVNYSRHVLEIDRDEDSVRQRIRAAFEAELKLIDFNWLMSEIRDHPKDFDRFSGLAEYLGGLDFDEPYQELGRQILAFYLVMQAAHQVRKYDMVAKAAKQVKATLRYRYSGRHATIWLPPSASRYLGAA